LQSYQTTGNTENVVKELDQVVTNAQSNHKSEVEKKLGKKRLQGCKFPRSEMAAPHRGYVTNTPDCAATEPSNWWHVNYNVKVHVVVERIME